MGLKTIKDPQTGRTYWGDDNLPTNEDAFRKFERHHRVSREAPDHITKYDPEKKS